MMHQAATHIVKKRLAAMGLAVNGRMTEKVPGRGECPRNYNGAGDGLDDLYTASKRQQIRHCRNGAGRWTAGWRIGGFGRTPSVPPLQWGGRLIGRMTPSGTRC
jgi:hypothetical protein